MDRILNKFINISCKIEINIVLTIGFYAHAKNLEIYSKCQIIEFGRKVFTEEACGLDAQFNKLNKYEPRI